MPRFEAFPPVPVSFLLLTTLLLSTGLLAATVAGCSGPEATVEDMPEWMMEKPEADDYLLGTGTATSEGMQAALEKAEVRARGDIASTVEVRFQGLTKDFREEAGGEYLQQFTQAQKEVVSQFLSGTRARERKIVGEGGRQQYRAYVLMEMPIGQASTELLSKLKESESLYARFRASEAFQELREAAEKYDAEKYDEEKGSAPE
jgi:hypothetical protein